MTQKSGSHATFLQKNKLLGKQACPNENSLQAQGKILSKPWITKGMRTSIRIKITFFNADWENYKLYRKKITSLTRVLVASCQ